MPLRLTPLPRVIQPDTDVDHAEQALNEAIHSHMQGEWALAETQYRRILETHPEHIDVLFLLGSLYLQAGHFDLAISHFAHLITLSPQHRQAYFHLGLAYQEKKQLTDAEHCFIAAIELDPADVQARVHMAHLMVMRQRYDEAYIHYHELMQLDPTETEFQIQAGLALVALSRHDEAEQIFRNALIQDPQHHHAQLALGKLLLEHERYEEAESMLTVALRNHPAFTDVMHALGRLYLQQAQYTEAENYLTQAIHIDANRADILNDLGIVQRKQARLDEAEHSLRQALIIDPQCADAHFNLATVLLQRGSWQEGWAEYEWRFHIKGRKPVTHVQPVWAGEALADRTILVQSEQGYGDTFQFIRYLMEIKRLGARVIFECQPGLKRLLSQCDYIDELIERNPPLVIASSFDFHIPLLSLPRVLGTTAASIPQVIPYVHSEADQVQRWRARLAHDHKFKIGIVWTGRISNADNHNRRCRCEDFAPLAAMSGVSIYSLQIGEPAVEFAQQAWSDPSNDLQNELNDFADTAAAMHALDLIITVDTGIAHLAGAMGRPVWVLLSNAPDWRWLAKREDSPWYPSMRLFRQRFQGDWEAPMAQVVDALQHLLIASRDVTSVKHHIALEYSLPILTALKHARSSIQSGLYAVALQELRAILELNPHHVEANALMGQVRYALHDLDKAEACLMTAISSWPDNPVLHRLLGMVAQRQGDDARATRHLERALKSGNADAETWFALAGCCQRLGLWEESLFAYRQSLYWRSNWPEAAERLGTLLLATGRREEAERFFRQALEADPACFSAHLHLGDLLYEQGKWFEAESTYRSAIKLQPETARVHNNLGVTLKALGKLDEAERALRTAVRLQPNYPEALNNLGNVLFKQAHMLEAEAAYRQALRLDPANAQAYNNLGIVLQASGAIDAALQCYDTATLLQPKFAQAHWNRALGLLQRGDYRAGWHEYEWGFEAGTRLRLPLQSPLWSGTIAPGKTLLVHAEQGFGDTLQFVRFLGFAKQRVGTLVFSCQPALYRLLVASRALIGADVIISDTDILPAHDFHCALLSLPHVLELPAEKLASHGTYIQVENELKQSVMQHMSMTQEFKVGLVWAGLSTHQNDQQRSCGLAAFYELFDLQGVRWFSLQKGTAELELEECGPVVQALGPKLEDFADTAAVIANLDLVITVDTAVAHLAGAMGKPVWVVLPYAADWRWGTFGHSTDWYASMRLFRQTKAGYWKSLFVEIKSRLQQVLHPPNI